MTVVIIDSLYAYQLITVRNMNAQHAKKFAIQFEIIIVFMKVQGIFLSD